MKTILGPIEFSRGSVMGVHIEGTSDTDEHLLVVCVIIRTWCMLY